MYQNEKKQFYVQAHLPVHAVFTVLQKKYRLPKGSMKRQHLPAENRFIDFAGKKMECPDSKSGQGDPVELSVAILPHGQYTDVQVCMT